MIPNYPYFGLPNYMRYINPNNYPQQHPNMSNIKNSYSATINQYSPNFQRAEVNNYNNKAKSRATKINGFSDFNKQNSTQPYPIFNLLGLNIYFDDILIVCILFFLYSEHVDDPFLFIVLVLLLMS